MLLCQTDYRCLYLGVEEKPSAVTKNCGQIALFIDDPNQTLKKTCA